MGRRHQLFALCVLFTANTASGAYVDFIRDDPGLVSYWSFEEADFDGEAIDFTGLGTADYGPGITPAEGIVGQAAFFPGDSEAIISIPNESEYDFTESLTIEAWFKTTGLGVPWQALLGKGDSQWRLHQLRETGGFTFGTNDGSSPTDMFRDNEGDIPVITDGEWHHIVGVFDAANDLGNDVGKKQLYLDGLLVGEQDVVGNIRSECGANCDLPVMLGGNAQKPDDGFRAYSGFMDEVAIYDRALSAEAILVHYAAAMEEPSPTCDLNGDTTCDIGDIDVLMTEIANGSVELGFDLTGDGVVDDSDRDRWLTEAGNENGLNASYLVGDANLDGTVNAGDLNSLAVNWLSDKTKWSEGNFSGASVNANDLNAMAINWQQTADNARAAVPEPSAFALLFCVVPALLRRRALWSRRDSLRHPTA